MYSTKLRGFQKMQHKRRAAFAGKSRSSTKSSSKSQVSNVANAEKQNSTQSHCVRHAGMGPSCGCSSQARPNHFSGQALLAGQLFMPEAAESCRTHRSSVTLLWPDFRAAKNSERFAQVLISSSPSPFSLYRNAT
jgi:hypothetical protein